MKYERLTKRDRYWETEESWQCSQEPMYEEIENVYYRLAELEDKIESGTLVELPCKLDDKVYYVFEDYDYPIEGNVVGIAIEINGIWLHTFYEDGLHMWHTVKDIGQTIFLTKDEAEKRFEELKGEV